MSWCACGNEIPDGFDICPECEAFGDDDPLPSDERLVTDEIEPWFGEMGVWYGEEAA